MTPRPEPRAEDAADRPREADKLREEVALLRERLRALEERLERRKTEAK
jgi:polyhydroxyalkanoate synthesis regulator phasin